MTTNFVNTIIFVNKPASKDSEAALLHADVHRADTRRIYAAQMQKDEDWQPVVLGYSNSNVVWLSLEQIRPFVSKPGHKDELASMDVGEDHFYRRTKTCQLAGYDISRYNPSWG